MRSNIDSNKEYKRNIIISSMHMAEHLIRSGHNLVAVTDNKYHPEKKVFLFDDNENVRKDMSLYNKH